MPNNLQPIVISNDIYELQERWLEIGKKFFDMEDINLLKVGFLGYLMQITGDSIIDSTFERDSLRSEFYLSSATRSESIYEFAKEQNYPISNATPSKMSVNICISKKELIAVKTQSDDKFEFKIPKDSIFMVGGIPFMLENSIKVIISYIGTSKNSLIDLENPLNYALTATYDVTDCNIYDNKGRPSSFSKRTTPYLKTWTSKVQGEDYFFILADIWQIEKKSKIFKITSNDIADLLFFKADFTNQIAQFNVYYNKSVNPLPVYFNNTFTPDEPEYCFYSYLGDNNLQISFSSLPNNFRPKFNSELKVDIFTTKGAKGNFSFKDTGEITLKPGESGKLPLSLYITKVSDATGGKDKPTYKEIKKTLIENNLVRESIITENDLNIFFNKSISSLSINNGKIKIFKKRDDILKRIFSIFLMLKDRNNIAIPTNTIDLQLNVSDPIFSSGLKAGTIIIYDSNLGVYRPLANNEFPEEYMKNDRIIMYSLPYLVNIKTVPFPVVSYYKNWMHKEVPLQFKNINENINYEFIINNLKFFRNNITSDFYEISFNLNTNLPDELLENLKIRGIIKNGLRSIGFIDFQLVDIDEKLFTAYLVTNDTFDSKGELQILNSIFDMSSDGIVPMGTISIPSNITMEIGLMLKGTNTTTKYDDFNNMIGIDDYCIAVSLNTTESVSLVESLSSIMNSELLINDQGTVKIKSLPVVGTFYFSNTDNYKDFYSLIDQYGDILKSAINLLENNNLIDMKLYNTYGFSKYFSNDTTHISMNFSIKLAGSFNIDLDLRIKRFICDFVEKSNNNNFLAVSNLIRELEKKFSEIVFIEFKGINNVFLQQISYIYPMFENMNKEQLINYVPEFINIAADTRSFSTLDGFHPAIKIEYI
jgi:hypothetical protein